MDAEVKIYKSEIRSKRQPSCSLNLSYFRKVFDIVKELSKEAANFEVSQLKREAFKSDEEFENTKKDLIKLYEVSMTVRGAKGELFVSHDKSIFDEDNLPNTTTFISFDSAALFRLALSREPLNSVKIEFDFSKPSIFDFLSGPSKATQNSSIIQVMGQHQTWVQGSYERILSTLDGYTTRRGWLHKQNVYDLLLWFIIVPLTFLNFHRLQLHFSDSLEKVPNIFLVGIYIYVFILVLYLFMIFFNYARWLYPYMELKTSLKNTAAIHRSIVFIVTLGIITNILSNFIFYLIK